MTTEPSHIASLLLRFHRDNFSVSDRQELEEWVAQSADNAALYQELTQDDLIQEGLLQLEGFHQDAVRRLILERMPDAFGPARDAPVVGMGGRRSASWRWVAAAVIFAGLGTGAWWWLQPERTSAPLAQTSFPADVAAPAHSRATLTLAGGQQVALDSVASGALAQQGNVQVVKEANGQVAYKVQNISNHELLFNTLSNPRGSQVVHLTLSDGTKVWLNAESSIRYPAAFVGEDRGVEMTGEAYFEVAGNASKPFKVLVDGLQEVHVLGTSFNVNAYSDEQVIKTTLLEGSVRVTKPSVVGVSTNNDKLSVVLKPGQQAQLAAGEQFKPVQEADIEEVMAWKNGLFNFDKADIRTVMRELARWYDVDVNYEGTMPTRSFNGEIGKNLTLDQLLKVLSTTTRVHYTIEGKKLIIQP